MRVRSKTVRALIPLFLIGLTFVLVSAVKVSSQMLSRAQLGERVEGQIESWHAQISIELPDGQSALWNLTSSKEPLQLLRTCAIERKIYP